MRDSFFDEKVVSEDGARQKMGAPFQVKLAEVYCKQGRRAGKCQMGPLIPDSQFPTPQSLIISTIQRDSFLHPAREFPLFLPL